MRYIKRFIEFNTRIKAKPTKYFLLVVFILFALFLQAYMHNYNIVYIVLFFVFSVAGSSCIIGRLNLFFLRLVPLQKEGFFAKQRSHISFELFNNAKSNSYALVVDGKEIGAVDAKQKTVIQLEHSFQKRGYARYKPIMIESFFPFGHIKFYTTIVLEDSFLIYPKPEGISLDKAFAKEIARMGDIDSFESLKEYEMGESLSKIHWPSVAKGEIQSKKFEYTNEDTTLHFYFHEAGKSVEQRLSQLTLWVRQAYGYGFDFIIHLPKSTIHSKKEDKDAVFKQLALY